MTKKNTKAVKGHLQELCVFYFFYKGWGLCPLQCWMVVVFFFFRCCQLPIWNNYIFL